MSARIKLLRLLGAAMVTLAVVPWLGMSPAAATDAPVSGDTRATAHDGNVTTCAQAGLTGSDISGHVTASGGTTQYLDVTAVEAGYTVSGIVVKGGDNYNKYVPGQLGLGLTPPWDDLHAPMVGSQNQNVPVISHWFVCGSSGGTQTPTPTVTVTKTVTQTVSNTATVTQTVSNTATVTQTVSNTATVTTTQPGPTQTVTTVAPGPTQTVTKTNPGPTVTVTVTAPGPTTTTTLPATTHTVTVTEAGPTHTVTQRETVTAPGQTVTVTGPSSTHTVTKTLPAETVTVTQNSTQTVTAPGSTQTVTTTAPGQGGTVTTTAPGSTGTSTVTVTRTVTAGTSVLPTKIGNSTTPNGTGVLGTKTGVLADTGVDLPMGAALGLSFALLLAGGSLMALPGRIAVERKRRH